ncbi:MAG: DUF4209 domain-containing protein [candidate division WOR-3 bacterium]|nr:DUF4209 domain-containing protein [candidate division WOR-3 bacterium]
MPLTKEDFDASDWQSIIAGSGKMTCFEFATDLLHASPSAGEADQAKEEAVFGLLGYLAQLLFAHDSGNAVFVTAPVNVPKDNAALDILTENHLDAIALIVEDTQDPEMRARLADVLWLKRRDPEYARLAVDSYLESVARLENDWPPLADRLRRAAYIGHELGRKEHFAKVMVRAEELAKSHCGDSRLHLLTCNIEIMVEFGHGDPATFAPICEAAADKAMRCADQPGAERLWMLAAEWHGRARNADAMRQARINAAETHVKMADLHTRGSTPAHAFAVGYIEQAIAAYGRIANTKERVLQLRRRLEEHQAGSLAEMKGFSIPIDLSTAAEEARQAVRGKSFHDALLTLALRLGGGAKEYDEIVEEARKQNAERAWETLFTKMLVDSQGRTVAKSTRKRKKTTTGLAATDPPLWNRMVSDTVQFTYRIFADGAVEPARRQMLFEHTVGIRDWLMITINSPFVPPGRELLWANALHAGFIGDLPVMLHLLVPQLEHALRNILRQSGVATTSLAPDGIEMENDLSWLLDHDKTREVLGDTNVFHLKCLLDERVGFNLRNRVAHGLLNDGEAHASQLLYLWWSSLRLCLIPIASRMTAQPSTNGGSREPQDGQGV